MLIIFLLYRAVYSETDDARYYCFEGMWENQISARVTGEVEKIRLQAGARDKETKTVYLKNCSVRLPEEQEVYHLRRLCVYLDRQERICPGNRLALSGTLREFAKATNPGQFDQRQYYKEKGIYYQFAASEVTVDSHKIRRGKAFLYRLRERLQQAYINCLPEREGGIVSSLILGDKSLLDMDIRKLYQESGIGHLLAISGLHVAILGMTLYRILKFLFVPDMAAVPLCGISVIAYGAMTDFSISTSRAVIMMLVLLAARWIGRTYDGKSALAFAAILILLQYPFALFSCGFLLSFGAMTGIYVLCPLMENIWFGGRWRRKEKRRRRRRWENELRENRWYGDIFIFMRGVLERSASMLLLSASIQLMTVPVILYFYFEIPLYGIVINLFVLPLSAFAVVLSVLGGVIGCICQPLGMLLLGGVFYVLKFYERICLLFQKLPGHMQIMGRPDWWQLLGYYAVLAIVFFYIWRRGKTLEEQYCHEKRQTVLTAEIRLRTAGMIAPALCILFLLPVPNRSFYMTMLDVGQGDSIFIHTPAGENILLDGGSTSVSEVGRYRILPFLKSKGIRRLDYMIMTHSDEDHINGLEELLEASGDGGITVELLALPELAEGETEKGYQAMMALAQERGVETVFLSEGQAFHSGDLSLVCLHPCRGFAAQSPNEESVTLSLRYQAFSCLLTGDLEGEGEELVTSLLQNPQMRKQYHIPDRYTVLKVAHHGSKNSSDEGFLSLVSPEISLISCGRRNRYGHPHEELLERLRATGSVIVRTDQSGAVCLKLQDGTVRYRCSQG